MPWPPPGTGDLDGDGWSPPEDCDEADASINPDAVDVPYNGIDEDCTGADLVDVDGDGHDAQEEGGADCNDANAAISPEATELCDNGTDEDCDAEIDEGCTQVSDPGDPGGIAWACASGAPAPCSGLVLLVVGVVLIARVTRAERPSLGLRLTTAAPSPPCDSARRSARS